MPVWNLLRLPETVTFEEAAMLEPMSVAVHAMRRVMPSETDTVAVCGLGTIGMLLTMFLLGAGVRKLLLIGNKDFQRQAVQKLGISEFTAGFSFTRSDCHDRIGVQRACDQKDGRPGWRGGMERYFNTEGLCNPERHYMVRLDGRLRQMKERYVDRGSYFVINRGRQYGKTTILRALAEYIRPVYAVVSMDFLSLLRRYYLNREKLPAFHSVIMAGVYDIKNLKLKIRPETEHRYNSPWNIAARFTVDMNFSPEEIADMLREYETDHKTGMNVTGTADLIYNYTSGHPYLVLAICKRLDEEIFENKDFADAAETWTVRGIGEAVRCILDERIPLFDSMMRHLEEYPKMKDMLRLILFQGRRVSYNPDHPAINLAAM